MYMIAHNLKVALRNLMKYKLQTTISVLSIAIALGYREQALASVFIAFGGPVAVSSITMAQQMDGDSDLAAELVISTTLFSVLTLFVFIFIFKMLGLV